MKCDICKSKKMTGCYTTEVDGKQINVCTKCGIEAFLKLVGKERMKKHVVSTKKSS